MEYHSHTVRDQELAMVFIVTCKGHPVSIVAPRYLKQPVFAACVMQGSALGELNIAHLICCTN